MDSEGAPRLLDRLVEFLAHLGDALPGRCDPEKKMIQEKAKRPRRLRRRHLLTRLTVPVML